jgi:hypothetical protein
MPEDVVVSLRPLLCQNSYMLIIVRQLLEGVSGMKLYDLHEANVP